MSLRFGFLYGCLNKGTVRRETAELTLRLKMRFNRWPRHLLLKVRKYVVLHPPYTLIILVNINLVGKGIRHFKRFDILAI